MQKYKDEFQNLCNAHKVGSMCHNETLDKMVEYINHLEHFLVNIYEDYSIEDLKRESMTIIKAWEMGEKISNRFSLENISK